MKLKKCPKCKEYTMKDKCPKCREETVNAGYKFVRRESEELKNDKSSQE